MKEETFDEIIQSAAFGELMQSAKEAALILRGNLPPASEFVCTGTKLGGLYLTLFIFRPKKSASNKWTRLFAPELQEKNAHK